MSFHWRKVALFGAITLSLPILFWRAATVYTPDGASIANCERCRRLLDARACNKLMAHLTDDHQLEMNAATETVRWVYTRILNHRIKS